MSHAPFVKMAETLMKPLVIVQQIPPLGHNVSSP
jgi:hypothetical protein